MITAIITGGTVALIGVLLGTAQNKIHKKIDALQKEHEKHHKENVKTREGDRELLLATSDVVGKLARKYNGEGINGELKEAEDKLQKIRDDVTKNTRHVFFDYLEGQTR